MLVLFVAAVAKQDISRETVKSISALRQVTMVVVVVPVDWQEQGNLIKSIKSSWLRSVQAEAVEDMVNLRDVSKAVDLIRGNILNNVSPLLLLGYIFT
jgi:hypothetical protein